MNEDDDGVYVWPTVVDKLMHEWNEDPAGWKCKHCNLGAFHWHDEDELPGEGRKTEILTGEALCRARGYHDYEIGSSGLGFCRDCPKVEGD